jgi:hypothetical protein
MTQNRHSDQWFAGYFPTHPNREIFGGCRELEQVIREIILAIKEFGFQNDSLGHSGAQKMPFLAYTGQKSNLFAIRLPRRPPS